MPYSRQRPRIAPTGRVTLRLNTLQRDLFIHSPDTPKNLAHVLHRATVREGKLTVRVSREELDALIAAAANVEAPDRQTDRALAALLRYMESLEDRFAEPEPEEVENGEGREAPPPEEEGRRSSE